MNDGPARIIETYFALWLRESDIGRQHTARLGVDGAMDALWELLNAGFIKLQGDDGHTITGISPCCPPEPPAKPVVRPIGRRQ